MCDVLGMSFNVPVNARISLDVFQLRGESNPDGWGLAFYRQGLLQVVKEAWPSVRSSLYDFIEDEPESSIFISHVRRSTAGIRSYLNTHPFYRTLTLNGSRSEWAFAHNGTLETVDKLKLERNTPLGETDSEHAFCHILDWIEEYEITDWNESYFDRLQDLLREINNKTNTFNCLMADGIHLFCYSDETRHNGGLRYVLRDYPFGSVDLIRYDEKLGAIEIRTVDLDTQANAESQGYIVVTRELTDEDWIEFEPGQLTVFKSGSLVYQG
jgi:glutamine amidotransferase